MERPVHLQTRLDTSVHGVRRQRLNRPNMRGATRGQAEFIPIKTTQLDETLMALDERVVVQCYVRVQVTFDKLADGDSNDGYIASNWGLL